jgi:hypothetical protein
MKKNISLGEEITAELESRRSLIGERLATAEGAKAEEKRLREQGRELFEQISKMEATASADDDNAVMEITKLKTRLGLVNRQIEERERQLGYVLEDLRSANRTNLFGLCRGVTAELQERVAHYLSRVCDANTALSVTNDTPVVRHWLQLIKYDTGGISDPMLGAKEALRVIGVLLKGEIQGFDLPEAP